MTLTKAVPRRMIHEAWPDYFDRLYALLPAKDQKTIGSCSAPLMAVVAPENDLLIQAQIAKTHVKASTLPPGGQPAA